MAVDLSIISGFVGLQIVPRKWRDRTRHNQQQSYQQDSPDGALGPPAAAGRTRLRLRRIGQLDASIPLIAVILPERFQRTLRTQMLVWHLRIELRIQLLSIQADSQIATGLAIREPRPAVIFNQSAHVSPPVSCIYKRRAKKIYWRSGRRADLRTATLGGVFASR